VIFGSGGHARVVIDAALASGRTVLACISLEEGTPYRGVPTVRDPAERDRLLGGGVEVFVAIGDNNRRADIGEELLSDGSTLATISAPSSTISPTAVVGAGTVLMNNSVVNSQARVGEFCIVNTSASVDHDCELSRGVHIGPGSHLAGGVVVGERSFLGAGVTVVPGIKIGMGAVVGAGSTVIRDVADGAVVYGVPARAGAVNRWSPTE
jgi:UDP-perosamine 4-acetyltransferase